ncbi:MAG TPA: hypothetical protein VK849_07105, partial [Longimicrobiales bacterium]|nr:hypothetical protein [Longimicrobiales bacterium]
EVAREVLTPLVEALTRLDPGRTHGILLDAAEQAARDGCGGLDSEASLPWDDASLAAAPDDSHARRLDKLLLRVSRRIRPSRPRPVVPLRAFAWHMLSEEVAWPQRRAFARAQRAWAHRLGELERTWAAWAERFLRAPGNGPAGASPEGDGPVSSALALQAALERAAEDPPHQEARNEGFQALSRVEALIERELPLAGTLAFRPSGEPLPLRRDRHAGPTAAWAAWCTQSLDRLSLLRSLLDVMMGSEAVVDRFAEQVREPYVEPLTLLCREAGGEIRALGERLDGVSGAALPETLAGIREDAEQRIDEVVREIPSTAGFERAVLSAADALAESVHGLTRQVPASLTLHQIPDEGEAPSRPTEGRSLRVQDAARQAFDVLRMERIRDRPRGLVERAAPILGDRERFVEVVRYGLDAAVEELESGEEDADERARTLAREGLDRAADAIAALPGALDGALQETRAEVAEEVRGGWGRLVERALAQRMQGQLLDVRSRLEQAVQDLRDRLAPWVRDGTRRIRPALARLRIAGSRLLRHGRSLVGAEVAQPRAGLGTARLLAEPERVYRTVPHVYQRLFSLSWVSDPGLLAGREGPLGDVEARWLRWRDHEGVPLVVVGRPGAGVSSFFLVVTQKLENLGARALHVTLERRFTEETDLAAHLSGRLGLEPADSLAGLAAAILDAPEGSVPDLVTLEGIEHLYLRIPGGTDLIERLLTLTSETEPRMFWMASVTQSAWQLVQKAEPSAVSQVDALDMSALDAEEIRTAVLARHRRSGVPLSYVEPTEGRRLLRRRLRRLRGTTGHQKILEDDFFERLHRSSGGNIRFALFQWLRACDFTAEEGKLRVHPLESIDFSFLDGLDLTQNFTLKALLEHRTLTLEEHDRIFRIPRQESYQIVESLRHRSLIEAIDHDGDEGNDLSEVRSDRRYALVPLLTGAVAAHLARRNILH